jgi:hypothetical protein
MNFWKQQTHILSYFGENFRGDKRLPSSFINGFLEVSLQGGAVRDKEHWLMMMNRAEIRSNARNFVFVNISL